MSQVSIDPKRCKGCNLCINACPRRVLGPGTLGCRGYSVVAVVAPDDCSGCGLCASMCPDVAITISR